MSSRLAAYFTERRKEKGLILAELAKLIGYSNITKGIRRIANFEETGYIAEDLLAKLTVALGIDQATVNRLRYEDYREWFSWVNAPIEPYLVLRCLHGGPILLPDYLQSVTAMEHYAILLAMERQGDVGLVLSRRILVWFGKDGSIRDVKERLPGEP
jgi:hypothetical protein